jgi:hypothetical protein
MHNCANRRCYITPAGGATNGDALTPPACTFPSLGSRLATGDDPSSGPPTQVPMRRNVDGITAGRCKHRPLAARHAFMPAVRGTRDPRARHVTVLASGQAVGLGRSPIGRKP